MEPEFNTASTLSAWKARLQQYAVPALAVFGGLAIILMLFGGFGAASLNKARDNGISTNQVAPGAPSMPSSMGRADVAMEEMAYDGDFAPMPIPDPSPYVPNLEQYETTDYTVSARTKDFDEACELVRTLKADNTIDFKRLDEQLNHCSATFYTSEERAQAVRERLAAIAGAEVTRSTVSVTRQREQLATESDVLRQQLTVVETTLADAERQYDEITEVARASNDASALTKAIRDKLSIIETLNQKRINLLSRLQHMNQQAADLEERIGVVAFNVSFTRSYPLDLDQKSRQWEAAWKELDAAVTTFLIGFSAYLGIFVLNVVQYAVYFLIIIVVVRFGWKLVRRLWRV